MAGSDKPSFVENWLIVIFGLSLIISIIFACVLFILSDTLLDTLSDTLLDTTNSLTPNLSNGIITVILFFSICIAFFPYLPIILGTPLPECSHIKFGN